MALCAVLPGISRSPLDAGDEERRRLGVIHRKLIVIWGAVAPCKLQIRLHAFIFDAVA